MSSSSSDQQHEQSPDSRMDNLDRRAKVARSRLMRTIDALDARRHQVVELGETAKKLGETAKTLAMPTALTVLGAAALLGIGTFAFGLGFKIRHRRSLGFRVSQGIGKVIRDLNIVPPRPSLARRMLERAAISLVAVTSAEVARRVLKSGVIERRLGVGSSEDTAAPDAGAAEPAQIERQHDIAVRTLTSSTAAGIAR